MLVEETEKAREQFSPTKMRNRNLRILLFHNLVLFIIVISMKCDLLESSIGVHKWNGERKVVSQKIF